MHAPCQKNPHKHHVFYIHTSDMTFTNEQQSILDNILQNLVGLHVLSATPGIGKTLFVEYLAQYFQLLQKNVLMCATTGVAAFDYVPLR